MRSVVNQPLEPLPKLTPLPPEPPHFLQGEQFFLMDRDFDRGQTPTTDADGFGQVPKVRVGPLEFTIFSMDWAPLTMNEGFDSADRACDLCHAERKRIITPERFVGKSPINPIDLGVIQVVSIE